MTPQRRDPEPGDFVILTTLPPGFVDDLPESDQIAIRAIVGKPVLLESYEEDGRAAAMQLHEPEFVDGSDR